MTLEDRADVVLDFAKVLYSNGQSTDQFCLPPNTSVTRLDYAPRSSRVGESCNFAFRMATAGLTAHNATIADSTTAAAIVLGMGVDLVLPKMVIDCLSDRLCSEALVVSASCIFWPRRNCAPLPVLDPIKYQYLSTRVIKDAISRLLVETIPRSHRSGQIVFPTLPASVPPRFISIYHCIRAMRVVHRTQRRKTCKKRYVRSTG